MEHEVEQVPVRFDPYHKWLGIPPDEQPPNLYRLLGIRPFESDPDVISNAADRHMRTLKDFQTGPNSALSQKLLNEVAAARVCLLNPARKQAYDRGLQESTVETVKIDDGPVRHGLEPLQSPPIQIDHAAATRRVVSNGQKGARKNVNMLLIAGAVAAGAATIGGIYMATSSGDREENGKKVHRMTEKDLASTTHGQPKLPEVPKFDPTQDTSHTAPDDAKAEPGKPHVQQTEGENREELLKEERIAIVRQIFTEAIILPLKTGKGENDAAELLREAQRTDDPVRRSTYALGAAFAAVNLRKFDIFGEAIALTGQEKGGFMTSEESEQFRLHLLRHAGIEKQPTEKPKPEEVEPVAPAMPKPTMEKPAPKEETSGISEEKRQWFEREIQQRLLALMVTHADTNAETVAALMKKARDPVEFAALERLAIIKRREAGTPEPKASSGETTERTTEVLSSNDFYTQYASKLPRTHMQHSIRHSTAAWELAKQIREGKDVAQALEKLRETAARLEETGN
ncbi:MAG: hypothetical protein PHU04_05805, partial [Candidatus Peribacteraceae bacterium]|nr:hypothetical protein [Candidatus Peribacteraceae bacterium]